MRNWRPFWSTRWRCPVPTRSGKAAVAGGAVTVTVADPVPVPPAPVHANTNEVDCVRVGVTKVPDVGRLPDQPPDAVQLVALVEDQLRVEVPPLATVVGFAVIVTVGTSGVALTATVAVRPVVPPGPLQFSV
jgi:hypothetical protein